MIQMIALDKLALSDLNVRKTERDADIASLANDILARGLKQNLVATPGPRMNRYQVVAGGRRFQAMQLLVDRGDWKKDAPVPVMVEKIEQGVETSLAENLHRVAMNPADEFDAFRTIIDAGEGEEEDRITACARRFGVTLTHVKGRLRLAALAAPILEALRTNVIGLGSAMAYASVTDTELQAKTFAEQCKSNWKPHDPQQIRDSLNKKTLSAVDPKVKFITLDRYVAAGGRVEVDLFTIDAAERLIDTKLVDKLVGEVFAERKAAFVKKHKLKDVLLASQSYQTPKAPEGWASEWDHSGDKLKARAKAKQPTIGCAWINGNGELERGNYIYIPVDPDKPKEERQGYQQLTDEERAAQERARGLRVMAFRLAFPKCAGTDLENRVWHPRLNSYARIDESNDGEFLYMEAQIRVTRAEFEAQLEAAGPAWDMAIAEQKRADEEREAARVAAREAKQAEAERIRGVLLANPPAVVADEEGNVFFRWGNDEYYDVPESESDDAEGGYTTLEELLDDVDVVQFWDTLDEYDAAVKAAATEDA